MFQLFNRGGESLSKTLNDSRPQCLLRAEMIRRQTGIYAGVSGDFAQTSSFESMASKSRLSRTEQGKVAMQVVIRRASPPAALRLSGASWHP
jgi:hypothetical protein